MSRISTRAIVVGLALIPFNALFIVQLEWVMRGPYLSNIALIPNAIVLLLLLIGANALLRHHAPSLAFNQAELFTIYTMVAISAGLAGCDGVPILNQLIPHGAWFGSVNDKWGRFLGAFPDWLVIKDVEAVRGHYLGNSTFYTAAHLRAWAMPILAWTAFVTLMLWTAMCLNVLIRRQWQDRERLFFPITWLPLEMTEPSARLFSNRLMWGGFALAAGLGLYNGTAFLYPSLPMLPIGTYDLKPYFTTKPWNAIDWFPTSLHPLVIGLGYLLPLDLLFSTWFFFLFWKAQRVVSNIYAWDVTPDFPFIKEQAFGALLGLALFYLWTGRRALLEVWYSGVQVFRRPGPNTRTPEHLNTEALSYRTAFLGLGLGLAGLIAFCVAAGMSLWLAVAFFVIYFAIVFVVVRIRAELGPPIHDFHFTGPDRMIPRALGVDGWRQSDLAMLSMFWFNNRAHRGDTPPIGMEGLYAAHRRGWEPRRMFAAVMLAVVVGSFCAMWLHEHQAYRYGETAKFSYGSWAAAEAFNKMAGWVDGTQEPRANLPAVWAMGVGFVSCMGLLWTRLRFVCFPLHPIGYVISSSWSIHLVWLPLLLAWLFKSLTLRYGGLTAYRRFLPFFLGLILGDCVEGCFWGLISLLFNMRTYSFFGE